MGRVAMLGVLAWGLLAAPGADARPQRLVSLNLCGDQYLVRLAERERIKSLSPLATDRDMSLVADAARGLPQNRGRAEDILLLEPDLVLAGGARQGATLEMLRRLGVPVLDLDLAENTADVAAETRRVASALGSEAAGETWIASMQAAFAVPAATEPAPRAIYWDDNGYSLGRGTLIDELMTRAGYRNLAAELGLAGYGRLPLEDVILAQPDVLIVSGSSAGRPSRAREILDHPALRVVMEGKRTIVLPGPLAVCANPSVGEIVTRLAAARP